MFHLFRKVYLDFDTNIDAYKNRMVISATNGVQDDTNNSFYQGLTVADLVGDGKEFATEIDLFKKCKELSDDNDDQLIIFCDKNSFLHMFIAWHKSLLSSIDADSLWSVFTKHVDKESYNSAITGRSEHVRFDQFKPSAWDKDLFVSQFSSINVTPDRTWNNSIVDHIGIDYLLATHIVSSTEAVKAALKNKIKIFADRTMQDEIYDIKMYAALRSQDKKLHEVLSVSDIDTISSLFAKPVLASLSDPSFWNENEKMYASSKSSAITLSNVSDVSALITALKLFRVSQQGQKEDSIFVTKLDWLSWINGTLTDETLATLLGDENVCAAELITDTDWHKVNILFIDNILKLYRSNNTDSLSKYSIAL